MDSLQSLANMNCFGIMQEKINMWTSEFGSNCIESNIGKCCELLELNERIQMHLFNLVKLCAMQGDIRGPELEIRKLMLPYLGEEYLTEGLTSKTVINILTDVSNKRKKSKLKPVIDNKPPNGYKRCSKEGLCSDEMNNKLDTLRDMIREISIDKKKPPIKENRKEKTRLTRSHSCSTMSDSVKDINSEISADSNHFGNCLTSDIEEIRSDKFLQELVGQYNDLFSESRIHSMSILRQHDNDHANNQRMLFALVMTTAKHVAVKQQSLISPNKLEFRKFISNSVLKSLKAKIIYELLHKGGRYFQIHIPHNFQFFEMEDFIDKLIKLFWKFGSVKNGTHLSKAVSGELFDEHKYRRSYDSDFNSPIVSYHIWPCLLQGNITLVKGEAYTKLKNKSINNSNNSFSNNSSLKNISLK